MTWLEQAFGIEPEPIAPAPKPRRQAPVIESFWCVVRQPFGDGDYGETIAAFYFVTDGKLWLCDEHGKTGDDAKSYRLAPGESPRAVASRLRREGWMSARSDKPGFGGRLNYGPAQVF